MNNRQQAISNVIARSISCPLCKSRNTTGEIKHYDTKEGKSISIDPLKARVCYNCKNKEGEGYAFIPEPITEERVKKEEEFLDYIQSISYEQHRG